MNQGKKTLFGVVSGIAVAAAAIFLSKKENRDKTKAVAKKASAQAIVVAKKTVVAAKKAAKKAKVVSVKAEKKAQVVKKIAQKRAAKIRAAVR